MLVTEDRADHIDLNFGCPVPKVTRKGGGAALPWKTELFRSIVAAVVREASPYSVPVTVKMRVGIDAEHITYLEAGRIAEAEGWRRSLSMGERHPRRTRGRPTGRRSPASRRP
jgi:tRNA-dihydrouridine synthase